MPKKNNLYKKNTELQEQLNVEHEQHIKTKIKLRKLELELHAITQSRSYKLSRVLAMSKQCAIITARGVNPKRQLLIAKNKRHVKTIYNSADFKNAVDQPRSADLAVILHLYYVDMWPVFAKKLKLLKGIPFDLFITIPEQHRTAAEDIKHQMKTARIAIVPNCGRDVLPFIEVVRLVADKGYTSVLKLHTKKSPHRDDGNYWRDKILDNLIMADSTISNDIIKCLGQTRNALVGPAGEYVSLLVNLSSTTHHIKKVVSGLYNKKTAERLLQIADEYGFFAGTMFWARLDGIAKIADQIRSADFEPELGQEDATLAHALERLFCVIPELEGQKIYETGATGLAAVDYHTTVIPDWAEVSLDKN